MSETAGGQRTHFLLIPHTHWDREWYQPFEVFRQRLVRLIDRLMDILEADPAYRSFHFDGQTIPLLDYEQVRGRSERLRQLVSEGRIKIGPWFVLPDEFLVSGEALIRNLGRGIAVGREFGADPVPVGYLPDMFGHVAQMPQLFRGFGLSRAVVWRGVTPDVSGQTFVWEAPDGSAVDTVFFPVGYGFGSNLPREPHLLFNRLAMVAEQIGGNARERLIGLMNGTDHTEPRADVPQNLEAALAGRPGWSWEFSDLETFVTRLLAALPPASRHRGELRSACRTLILPSVASARLFIKKQDFDCDAGLTRDAEPLAALARALGGPDFTGFLDYAWSLLLENHPHDSICGCSIDPVHDEMETRFAKVAQVTGRVRGESMVRVAAGLGGGPALVARNFSGATDASVVAELHGSLPRQAAVQCDGQDYPVQVLETIEAGRVLTDQLLPRDAGLIMLYEMLAPEIYGLHLQDVKVAVRGDTLDVRIEAAAVPNGIDLEAAKARVEKAANNPAVTRVRAHAHRQPRALVAARLSGLPGYGVAALPLVKSGSTAPPLDASADHIETDLLGIRFLEDGSCTITDKPTGLICHGLQFLDVGDRGDTYNFDPVPDDTPITVPKHATRKLVSAGPVAASVEIRHRLRVPAGLTTDRSARAKKAVSLDLVTQVRVLAGSRRVEFHTRFINTACDHRLQAGFSAPFVAERVFAESAFGVVERAIENPALPREPDPTDLASVLLGREGTYTTSPHKTLAFVNRGDAGMAVMNRGLCELDAQRVGGETRLALTLVRSVGWLSRPDLAMRPGEAGPTLPTPGAQCLRGFEWDYAVEMFEDFRRDDLLAAAHAFAFPPRLSMLHEGSSGGPASAMDICVLSNPRVYLSALRPVNGGLEARLVNGSSREEDCRARFSDYWRGPELTDFLGRPVRHGRARLEGNTVTVTMRPGEIVTVRLQGK